MAVIEKCANSSVVRAAGGNVFCDLDGEAVILNLMQGIYYGLNEVGSRVWELLQEPGRVEDICDVIVSEYAVDRGRCERDLAALLEKLADRELIVIEDSGSSGGE